MMRKVIFTTAALLVAFTLSAQNRGHAVPMPMPITGSTVSGVVTAVNGNNVSLANGLVVVDVSQAKITDDRGQTATITPGSSIIATLQSNSSLKAANVFVTRTEEVKLSGTVQSVNASGSTLQLLGLTIHTDANTSFGGMHNVKGLSDVTTGDLVVVQANASGQNLVATSVLVLGQLLQIQPTLIHGTVKNIGTDSWVITNSRRGDVTIVVNSQTKIIGSPKVGDTVDVLVNVDSASNYVAITIAVAPNSISMHLMGVVKSIVPHTTMEPCPTYGCIIATWDIGPTGGMMSPDFLVQQIGSTNLVGNPKVGDRVDALVQQGNGAFVAISITKQ